MTFHRQRVRASTPCYRRFTLPMDRSLIFGSTPYDLDALLALAFAAASGLKPLTLPHRVTRGPIMQKVRGHPFSPEGLHRAPTECRYVVSGTVSLPYRGTFHHFRSRYWFAIGR